MIISGLHLLMMVIGFIMSMMFIVFVFTRLFCARYLSNSSMEPLPTASRSNTVHYERRLHGLDPALIATFPTKKYSDDFFSSGEDSQCTVCLAEYHEKDILRILPACGHFFHVSCIDLWLQQHSTCPVCRVLLRCKMQPMFSSLARSYAMDSIDPHLYHSPFTGHGYSSRANNSQRMETIREDLFASELDAAEAGESISSAEDNQVGKDQDFHDSQTSMSRVHPIHSNP